MGNLDEVSQGVCKDIQEIVWFIRNNPFNAKNSGQKICTGLQLVHYWPSIQLGRIYRKTLHTGGILYFAISQERN